MQHHKEGLGDTGDNDILESEVIFSKTNYVLNLHSPFHYTENFVQSTLSALGDKLKGCSLVVGGDGRYYGKEATVKIIKMCAANGVRTSIHTYS